MPEDITKEIPIKLTEEITIKGKHPLVLIGPNGSGKTRFGVALAARHNAEFVGAVRNIAIEESIPMQTLENASRELGNFLTRHRSRYWQISNEINQLFSKLFAEDAASAVKYRDHCSKGEETEIEETNLMRLRSAWTDFFPGRDIDFSTYSPKVKSSYSQPDASYSANRMSDGERVALYLGARILNAESKIVVVDEPEVHFHSRLAVRFWDALENFRSDIRFVYITHDLSFALSRQPAQFVIVKSDLTPELIPLESEIPKTLAESILGAASFSIYARRIIFCEGLEGQNGDYSFYSKWFKGLDTAVLPVGSCRDVIQCTQAFTRERIVTGLSAIGIIDRDYWPDQFLNSLPPSVFVLPVHEIEDLFCIRSVFEAVGRHLSYTNAQIAKKYDSFITQAKNRFAGDVLAKQISERFKRRLESAFDTVINALPFADDLDTLQSHQVSALHPDNWEFDPEAIFTEERVRAEQALASKDENDFLRIFPGKVFLPDAARVLGMQPAAYKDLISSALVSTENEALNSLRESLQTAFSEMLPPQEEPVG